MGYPQYPPHHPGDVEALIRAYPLAWVIPTADPFTATPLPLLPEMAGTELDALFGHLSRRNPMLAVLADDPTVTILFQGPQGYISPRLVGDPTWGPTWNYAVIRVRARIEMVPDELDDALSTLATAVEADHREPWEPSEMGERYDLLRRYITAFRAHVDAVHSTFKLGQDENDHDFRAIVSGMDDPELAAWMERMRGDVRRR
ncbi:FMN-binding negative transcriptional regulator [Gordonia desulfuricans]|uniref:FMN-binding negative transcriptional regulator n=1 Tax=Gordonia desulfuricans TaxID=89051 RepID=A0A7K3LNY9_9ACTN|nr:MULTISPECIES: FMN-binding negative transcriptional regulator [Gordonia]NDK89267.1 FMN-binding negative transcriptional regulator [Gordonia desulfuricans]WLP91762.1 FMN-binding negative transcriptional regulator [Gordonia sp. NB41Y]